MIKLCVCVLVLNNNFQITSINNNNFSINTCKLKIPNYNEMSR